VDESRYPGTAPPWHSCPSGVTARVAWVRGFRVVGQREENRDMRRICAIYIERRRKRKREREREGERERERREREREIKRERERATKALSDPLLSLSVSAF